MNNLKQRITESRQRFESKSYMETVRLLDDVLEYIEQAEKAKGFIRLCAEVSFQASDMTGDDIQANLHESGLLVKTRYNPEIHGHDYLAEPGDIWYELGDFLKDEAA